MENIKFYAKILLLAFFIIASSFFMLCSAQNVAINTTGNSAYTSAILDLSNDNTAGTVGFLPPYVTLTSLTTFGLSGTASQSNGILVYNTGGSVAAGLYYWNNTNNTWVAMTGLLSGGTTNYLARWTSAASIGTGVAQDNGTSVGISTSPITPKSLLDVNGGVSIGTYAGTNAAPSNGVIISGQIGIGNNAPAASVIVDFTNAKATGGTGAPLLWPSNPAPSTNIASPVLGEEVYNTTTGCFNFYTGSAWVVNGCPCTAPPATPTIAASCSTSFAGSSITYTASVTTGVTFSWTVTATTGTPTVTGNGTSSITVTWPNGSAGTGTITLMLTNDCGTSTATKSVTLLAPTILGDAVIPVNTSTYGYTASLAGATYYWSSSSTYGTITGSTTGQSVEITTTASTGTFTLTCVITLGSCSYTATYPAAVAVCGTITLDATGASGDGNNTFTIITTQPNDLVLVSAEGYANAGNFTGSVSYGGPSSGNATVYTNQSDGWFYNCRIAVYWFVAPTPGTYIIRTIETGLTAPYYANFGLALTGFCDVPNASDFLGFTNYIQTAPATNILSSLIEYSGSYAIGFACDYWSGTQGDLTSWTGLNYINTASDIQDDYGVAGEAIPTPLYPFIIAAKTSGTMQDALLLLIDIK